MDEFKAHYLGGNPRYKQPEVVLQGDSRAGFRTVPMGTVNISINIIVKGFKDHVLLAPANKMDLLDKTTCDGCKPSHNEKKLAYYEAPAKHKRV
jgi:hypothetical protein